MTADEAHESCTIVLVGEIGRNLIGVMIALAVGLCVEIVCQTLHHHLVREGYTTLESIHYCRKKVGGNMLIIPCVHAIILEIVVLAEFSVLHCNIP